MSRFHYYLRVRYGECDAQKVGFNTRYDQILDASVSVTRWSSGAAGHLSDHAGYRK